VGHAAQSANAGLRLVARLQFVHANQLRPAVEAGSE
jgi:hypothetical protein